MLDNFTIQKLFPIIIFNEKISHFNDSLTFEKHYFTKRRALYDLSIFTCYFTDFTVNILDELSVYFVLLMSIDRLQAIRCPIKIKLFITQQK
jgi:hypothetical protein